MGGSVLERIAASARKRTALAKAAEPPQELRRRIARAPARRPFTGRLRAPGLHIIAEIKRASPSAGPLGTSIVPARVAADYAAHGAAALSVLTEPEFFDGDLAHLSSARAAVQLPVLMKDFFLEEYQLLQARAAGADCVLLIAALLGAGGLEDLLRSADALDLDALVEVHDEDELRLALAAGARLIGVNNRDLKTLAVDLEVSRRLAPLAAGASAVLISESGLRTRAQLLEMAALGFRGFLIGTHLIASGRPGHALAELLKEEA
jgi:indole-3-glycerol phosphate synthase